MRPTLLLATFVLAAACDNYDPATSFGGDTGGDDQWDADLPLLSQGEDPCVLIAQAADLGLVDSTPLVAGAPVIFSLAPDGASASSDSVDFYLDGGLLGNWDLSPYFDYPRPIKALQTEIRNPENNPTRDESLVVIWAVTSGPATLRQKHSGQYPPPDREWDMIPVASVGGDYRIGVTDVDWADSLNLGGDWVIDTFPAVSMLLGSVLLAYPEIPTTSAIPVGAGGPYFSTVWGNGYAWLPYGGICYLAHPSTLDGTG